MGHTPEATLCCLADTALWTQVPHPSLPSHPQGPWPAQDRPPPEAAPGRLPHRGVQSLHQVRATARLEVLCFPPGPHSLTWGRQLGEGLGCSLVSYLAWAG